MVSPPRLLSPVAAVTRTSPAGSAWRVVMSRVPPPKSHIAICGPDALWIAAARGSEMMRMVSRLMPLVDAASTSVITSGMVHGSGWVMVTVVGGWPACWARPASRALRKVAPMMVASGMVAPATGTNSCSM